MAKVDVGAIMTLESLIGGLSREEQIVAMELLWKRLKTESPSVATPVGIEALLQNAWLRLKAERRLFLTGQMQRSGLRIVFDEDQDFGWCRTRHCGWLR